MNRSKFAGLVAVFALGTLPTHAAQIGQIFVCYACSNTGDPVIDAALANNPGVASDGILFAFKNTSGFAIADGVLSLSGTTPSDTFDLPTIAAGGEFIFIPGVTSDGRSHPGGSLFGATGVMDTSDGAGGVNDSTIFSFIGLSNSLAVASITAGSNPPDGTFTPGDPGLIKPFRDNPANGKTSFVGDGPSGDGGCSNCYFGLVATLNTPVVTGVPEPSTLLLFGSALIALGAGRRLTRSR